jgi:PAS domain S-box-containing protein
VWLAFDPTMARHDTGREGEEGGAARWRYLVEHIQDAVVEFEIGEDGPIVRGVNQSFVDVFGYDRATIRGASLNEYIVPQWLDDEAAELDARTAAGEVNYGRVERETADGLREFLYRGIPYRAEHEAIDGFAVYTDLTEVNCYERQFDVLNRLLRHNLRNQANVILGNTDRLLAALDGSDADPGETAHVAAQIRTAAEELESLTEEATRIRRVLRATVPSDAAVDCVPLIRQLVAEYRETTAATVETDLPGAMPVRATDHLHAALDSLVDNAVRHNPAPHPRVRVGVAATDDPDWIDIQVDDDGPRIPDAERAVLVDDLDVTPLRHGTGLGLWVAKLTTESFGGRLSFGTSEWGGNRLTLRLQRA